MTTFWMYRQLQTKPELRYLVLPMSARLLTSSSSAIGPNRIGLHAFDEIELPYAYHQVIPARHPFIPVYNSGKLKNNLKPPLHLRDYRMDECFSYLIEFKNLKFLVWSSISTENAQPADVLFLRSVASQ